MNRFESIHNGRGHSTFSDYSIITRPGTALVWTSYVKAPFRFHTTAIVIRHSDEEHWRVVSEMPFLDAAATPRLWRSFYVPYFGPKNSVYTRYLLLENLRPVVVTSEVEPEADRSKKPNREERKSKKNIRHL